MRYISVKIDVASADVTEGAKIEIAVWIFPANPARVAETPSTIVLLHGGIYDKRYFDVHVSGRDGYSVAEALAERGHLVILPDLLGVSDSSRLPTQKKATELVVANHTAVTKFTATLTPERLIPQSPQCPGF